MFEVNSYMLNRLGWVNYSKSRGIGLGSSFFFDDPLVRYFILLEDRKICFILKELDSNEKQISKKSYKFIKFDYSNVGIPKFEIIELNSNRELFSLIIKNLAISDQSKLRNIKLNKILK